MNELIENKKKSEILAEYISEMEYGDVILHNEIEGIISEKHGTPKYNSEITRAKKIILNKYHKVIESVRGDGYRIINADDFVNHSLKHYRRGFNELQKGYNSLENAPVSEMTIDGRETYRRVRDRSIILLASMQGAKAELKALARRNPLAPELVGKR